MQLFFLRKPLPFLASALIALMAFWVTRHSASLNNTQSCTCNHGYGIDPFEYHLIAANLALHNQFPVYGFIGPPDEYQICKENTEARPYLNDLQKAGPVLFTGRPPVFPLLLGICYKLFGVNLQAFLFLCALCSALLAGLMPYAGYRLWGKKGLLMGCFSAVLFLLFKNEGSSSINAEYFTKLIAFICFLTLLIAFRERKRKDFFISGVFLGILLLTKGTFIFLPLLLTLYLLYEGIRQKNFTFIRNLSFLIGGSLLFIAPWSAYINIQVGKHQSEMQSWAKRFAATLPPTIKVNNRDSLLQQGNYSPGAIDYFNKTQQIVYTTNLHFILITNQVDTEILRSVNNEYCLDGDFHPEWKLISTSYYNTTYESLSSTSQILHFYMEHPVLAAKIFTAKLQNAFSETPGIFGACVALWGLFVLLPLAGGRSSKLWPFTRIIGAIMMIAITIIAFLPHPISYSPLVLVFLFALGIFCFPVNLLNYFMAITAAFLLAFIALVLLIYGDVRFIANIDGITCFAFMWLLYSCIEVLQVRSPVSMAETNFV